jgi:hypothetical protein
MDDIGEPVTPKTNPLVFHVNALRQPSGKALGLVDGKEVMSAAYDPHKHWIGAKNIVITRVGATLEACVQSISPTYTPGTIPTSEVIEEAIAFAAS